MSNLRYVPVLRCKDAEWKALSQLDDHDWSNIMPIIEIVPKELLKNSKRTGKSMLAERALKAIKGRQVYFDTHHVDSGNLRKVLELYQELQQGGVRITPVIHSSNNDALAGVLSKGHVALRVSLSELSADGIRQVLGQYALRAENVHLIIDCKLIETTSPGYVALEPSVPELQRFQSITLLGGSFPRDLIHLKKPGEYQIPRLEWAAWITSIGSKGIKRCPHFGDYTIQHPLFSEPPEFSHPSASIRYTAQNEWVIIRGQGLRVKGGPGYKQWPANAQLLVARSEFCGPNYSAGDTYIHTMSGQQDETGNPGTWLCAGINHHLAFVSRQVQAQAAT
jgi:hypothetical protein